MSEVKSTEVTYEDQKQINAFSKLNTRSHELQATVKAEKKVQEDLEDASNEIVLSIEDDVRYFFGDCLIRLSNDAAEEKLRAAAEASEQQVSECQAELDKVQEEMKRLKQVLYARFGSSINLEEE